jgi:hypothetical protein
MDVGSILVLLALLILIAAFIARPLLSGQGHDVSDRERRLSALQAESDKLLGLIQELDMDHTMGKVPEDDYQGQRAALVARGVEVLREMDSMPQSGKAEAGGDTVEQQLEEAVARLRSTRPAETHAFCGHCGQPLQPGDRFCPRCGTPSTAVESA